MAKNPEKTDSDEKPVCFVIMPISDPLGYEDGHFKKVYDDIFSVACERAGYEPIRADDVKETNFIHLDILKKIVESPMAICDLSAHNPNVLFELGLRQAFNKPTVLVQQVGTDKIFDIGPLRYTQYRHALKYREVIEDQKTITDAIEATQKAVEKDDNINSIVSLLSLTNPASLQNVTENDSAKMLQLILSEITQIKSDYIDKNNMNFNTSITNGYSVTNLRDDYRRVRYGFTQLQDSIAANKDIYTVRKCYDEFRHSHALIEKNIAGLDSAKRLGVMRMTREADQMLADFTAKSNS